MWLALGTPWEPFDIFTEELEMAAFEPAWVFLMDLEGGDLMHEVRGDPGGRTRFGIAENRHPEMWADGPPDEPAARAFYRRVYWIPLRLDDLHSQNMAGELLEFAVHGSTPRAGQPNPAVLAAQEAVNDVRVRLGQDPVEDDGIIGDETVGALNALEPGSVESLAWDGRYNLRQLRWQRTRKRSLVDQFFLGWTRRVIA